ncbi:MAG: aminodeoxychorismate lyase [Xanthomonadaceae bacterium]|nr:aminodeoxychorismate lyase [Xanthomonadaceae bacterium]
MFLGSEPVTAVAPDDRGLAYGESLFETMRAHRGTLPWWTAHMARLRHGAERLAMPLPDVAHMHAAARELLDGADGVLKLQLTRGGGVRGYAPDMDAPPFWMLSVHSLPPHADALAVIWCETTLASQPRLVGLKHGNRLEQVLAATEVRAVQANEGLMRDAAGNVIAATSANLFALIDGRWQTPALDACGVAGVMRGWLLAHADAQVTSLAPDDIDGADAVFLCNAVRGILPVRRLDARVWSQVRPEIRALQSALAQAHPGFDASMEAS